MTIADRITAMQKITQGYGFVQPFLTDVPATAPTGTEGMGRHFVSLLWNLKGTTLSSATFAGLRHPTGLADELHSLITWLQADPGNPNAHSFVCWLVRLYKFGTVDFTTTGDKFTHDAATFPVLRTVWGAASQPKTLVPVLWMSTSQSGTAPQFILKTAAGGTGYVDQDGNNTVGTKTSVFTAGNAARDNGFIMRLEDGDSGVRDIAAINVTVASTAGAAWVFGMEYLAPVANPGLVPSFGDSLTGILGPAGISPAVATSGTATSYLALCAWNAASTGQYQGVISGVSAT